MTTREWSAILDSFEARLHAQHEAMTMGPAALDAWEEPVPTAPIPRDLMERATALMWRCRELEDEIEQALNGVAAQLDRMLEVAATSAVPAEPMYFDSRV